MKKYLLIILLLIGFGGYSQTSYDADAQAFITALNADTNGVDLTTAEMNYITQMVEGMKSIGVWTKIVACYPIVGGNAFKHKFNLKDPRDLDVAFRLVYPNGATHNTNGMQGNGSTQYAETFLVPNTSIIDGLSMSFYCQNNIATSPTEYAMGSASGSSYNNSLIIRRSTNASIFLATGYNNSNRADAMSTTDSKGYWLGNGTTSDIYIMKNGVKISALTASVNVNKSTNSIWILGANGQTSGYTNKICSFASIGESLTDSEAIRLSHLIYYCQGILQRQ